MNVEDEVRDLQSNDINQLRKEANVNSRIYE